MARRKFFMMKKEIKSSTEQTEPAVVVEPKYEDLHWADRRHLPVIDDEDLIYSNPRG